MGSRRSPQSRMVRFSAVLLFTCLCFLYPVPVPAPGVVAAGAAAKGGGLAGLAGLAGVAGLLGPKLAAKAAIKAALVKKKVLLAGAAAGVPTATAAVGAGAKAFGLKGLGLKKKKTGGEVCETMDEEVWQPECSTTYTQECQQTSKRECKTKYTEQCETEHEEFCEMEYADECVTEQVEQCVTEHAEECWEEQEQVCDVWEHCEEEIQTSRHKRSVEETALDSNADMLDAIKATDAAKVAYVEGQLDKLSTEAEELATENMEMDELKGVSSRMKRSLHLLKAKLLGLGAVAKKKSDGGKCEQMEKCHWRPAKVCKKVPQQKCHYEPHETGTKVPQEKCWQEPKERCWEVPHEECWDEPQEDCWEIPKEECKDVKVVVRKKWCKQPKGEKSQPVGFLQSIRDTKKSLVSGIFKQ